MNAGLGHDLVTLMLHEERAARLQDDVARDRAARSVAGEGKPSRVRARRASRRAPVVPLQRRPGQSPTPGEPVPGDQEHTAAREAVESRSAS